MIEESTIDKYKKDRGGNKLDTNYLENNYITLVGKVTGEKRLSHEIYGERFYVFNLEIPRLSGNSDIIPVTISERIITDEMLTEGRKLLVKVNLDHITVTKMKEIDWFLQYLQKTLWNTKKNKKSKKKMYLTKLY